MAAPRNIHDAIRLMKQAKARTAADPYGREGLVRRQNQDIAGATATGAAATGAYEQYAQHFDASKGLNEWAKAAYASAEEGLNKNLRVFAGQAAGAGRLDTGLYDQDVGEIARGTQRDFSQALSGQALNAQALQAQVATGYGAYGERATERATDLYMSRREELENAAREKAERKRQRRRGIGGAIASGVGALGGFIVGGPAGATAGAKIGGSIYGAY